jgi:UDP-N-acetylmuramoyl-L-alanyl-D-glutamate--2,6-diaminopimelate ligase
MTGLSLEELVRDLTAVEARLYGDGALRVLDVRQDSRKVGAGDLFVARPGASTSGAAHVGDALGRGAVAVLVERGTALSSPGVPVIEVADARRALGFAAEAVHRCPTRAIELVGVTGTNGKTTTTWLAEQAISGAGGRAGRLGTLGFAFENESVDSPLTTPEADEVSRYAARVRDRGGTHLVMEVSSHALAQTRVDAFSFAVAVFTNLTQDHLDFHATMAAYAEAKLRLFTDLEPRAAVVNVDDPFGEEIVRRTRARVLRVSRSQSADVHPVALDNDARGLRGSIALPSGKVEIATRLVGEHNLDNVLSALAIVEALGLDAERAAAALGGAQAVPGRLERCDSEADDVVVLVDYAHTPDALRRALLAVRALTTGSVICVFGCGGDRDPQKRPKMGEAVGRGADRAIVTNDNPRSEAPERIAEAIEAGIRPTGSAYEVELDRARAIERAIVGASRGDVVLIAGKGHEPYQIIGSETRAFDDRVEARRALALRRGRSG